MKKIILDFKGVNTKKEIHAYLKEKMGFPDYYGANLDALYDMLTEIGEPTAVGFFTPVPYEDEIDFDFMIYLDRVREVFLNAEKDNGELAVILGDPAEDPYQEDEPEDFGFEEDEELAYTGDRETDEFKWIFGNKS